MNWTEWAWKKGKMKKSIRIKTPNTRFWRVLMGNLGFLRVRKVLP